MTRASDLAARAANLPPRQKAARETSEAAPVRSAVVPRSKPVRLSLDLAPQSYRALKHTCDDLAQELGRARVTQSEVMRAMVTLLDESPAVRQALTAALRAER